MHPVTSTELAATTVCQDCGHDQTLTMAFLPGPTITAPMTIDVEQTCQGCHEFLSLEYLSAVLTTLLKIELGHLSFELLLGRSAEADDVRKHITATVEQRITECVEQDAPLH